MISDLLLNSGTLFSTPLRGIKTDKRRLRDTKEHILILHTRKLALDSEHRETFESLIPLKGVLKRVPFHNIITVTGVRNL